MFLMPSDVVSSIFSIIYILNHAGSNFRHLQRQHKMDIRELSLRFNSLRYLRSKVEIIFRILGYQILCTEYEKPPIYDAITKRGNNR